MIRNVSSDHGPSPHKGIAADGHAADDGAVGPQGSAFLDEGRAHLVHLGDFCPWIVDISKDHRWAAEDTVFEGDAFIETDIVLDFAFVADRGIVRNGERC